LQYLSTSFDHTNFFFRSGADWNWISKTLNWYTDFAVDCQTWTLSVLGERTIDEWFGAGVTLQIWQKTQQLGGYKVNGTRAAGLGYSLNQIDQALSGEWTLGGINMLRILANETNVQAHREYYLSCANYMRKTIETEITKTITIKGVEAKTILYANKRYYIPFGWWANPLPATSSTGWGALVDANYNPFYLGGDYQTYIV